MNFLLKHLLKTAEQYYWQVLLFILFLCSVPVQAQNHEPVLSLFAEGNQTEYDFPADIKLNAITYDQDGSISKVEYFLCSSKLSEVISEPYWIVVKDLLPGTYSFIARATDNLGAVTESCFPVTIHSPDSICEGVTADFAYSNVCQGSNVSFWSTSSGEPYPNTFEWKVNGVVVSTGSSMNYTFGSAAAYTVQLSTGFNGKCAVKIKTIIVSDIAGPIEGLSAICKGQQNVSYSIPPVSNASYNWWVNGEANITGDGTNAVQIDFGQQFSDIHVGVNVNGCYKQSVLSLTSVAVCEESVVPCAAKSAFGYAQVCLGQTTSFWDLSTGMHNSYQWKINGVVVSTASNLQYTFTENDTYLIELSIGFNGTFCSTASQTLQLPETPGAIIGDSSVCKGEEYTFSVNQLEGASYNWWMNSDAYVVSGQGTHQVTVHIGDYFTTSLIKVGVNYGSCYKEAGSLLIAENCAARMDLSAVKIAPHPFSEQTNVSMVNGEKIRSLIVYNINGREIVNTRQASEDSIVIGEDLANGYYILQITTENGTYFKTLIKL